MADIYQKKWERMPGYEKDAERLDYRACQFIK